MTTLDIVILAVLAVGAARGFSTGVIRQVMGFIGLIVSFVVAVQLMDPVGVMIVDSLGLSTTVVPVVGFVAVFLALQIAAFALIRLVETLVGALKLTVLNRALGGAVGAFKAALLLSVVFLVLGRLGIPERGTQRSSSLYGPVAEALPRAWNFASERLPEVRRLSERFGDRVESGLPSGS